MYDLSNFTLKDMTKCGMDIRTLSSSAINMEEVAQNLCCYLYQNFLDLNTKQPAFALVRFFKTHSYINLPPQLQQLAQEALGNDPEMRETKCLTLLGTRGIIPEWNSRYLSKSHQVIPLVSIQMAEQVPMISQLIKQFGLEISTVLNPDPAFLVDLEQKNYNVFYEPQAQGSSYIPAQKEFVIPFEIKSVLGFGGMLPTGNLFAVILFSKLDISPVTAGYFKVLALNVKTAILPFVTRHFFT